MNRHKSSQSYETPWEFIHACERKFRLRCAWDLAANARNARAERFYDEDMNSLAQPWHKISAPGGFLWLNPPFNLIEPWAAKCVAESAFGPEVAPIVLLVPASVGTNWLREHIHRKADVLFLNGRITFDGQVEPPDWKASHHGQTWKPQPYPKDLMLCVYGLCVNGLGAPGYDVWTWGAKE